jgi:hypothetical protein
MSKRLNFWANNAVLAELACRGNPSNAIRVGMERYYRILEMERFWLWRCGFSATERGVMVQVCKGKGWEPQDGGVVSWACANADEDVYLAWQVDRRELCRKLANLTPAQDAALIDAIERYWLQIEKGEGPQIEELLA